MGNIRNIIFDLGGVVIDLDRQRAIRALENLGLHEAGALLGEYAQQGPFLKLETGEISSSELYDLLLPDCKPGTTASDIRDAFEEFLLGIPPERLEMLRRLRNAGYRLFVLSNTNPIMFNHWIDREFRQEGNLINDYFDGITVSFQEHACKPDPRIFKNIIQRYNLNPSETLFLDDSEANCEAARSLGVESVRISNSGHDSFMSVCSRLEEEAIKK